MPEWALILIGLTLTVGTGFFVASEFALVNLDRNELEARRNRGEKRLGPTIGALKITSTHLSGAQLGITLTTLLTGYTFEPAISRLLEGPLGAIGVPAGVVPAVGAVSGILLATLLSMIVGELVPKNFALALPRQTAKVVVPFQVFFTTVFKPVIALCNGTANALIRRMGIEPKEELSGARSAEELGFLVRRSATQGTLDADHATLLDRTLRFAERDAADVITPRVRMVTVDADDTADDVIATSLASGHSRFPVTGEDRDDIVGLVHVKQAFRLTPEERAGVRAADLASTPLFVPETAGVEGLLTSLRSDGQQVAIVLDEHGGTAGLVTIEDLVEEIVGELRDEHDRVHAEIVPTDDGFLFDPGLRPDELRQRIGASIPADDDYETVGGYVLDRLERIPEVGEEIDVPDGTIRVERLDGVRLTRLRWVPSETPELALTGEEASDGR
ncbi:hemolysin family protein [Agromyces aerolatus]|uniref:hemolysin family protein n=1 Tax=Agromyces sp. LY-1074 TaxID=3074080 RepID=UPI002866F4A8|nr:MULTISPECIES: hemolysin family protein [unclassified Agromyces]MDR5700425.1 hemolysin family protein [Agromyces sp. LY-1074]MDR5706946.1 hemolysin family protein [Agromyces sp. LY-1358]